MKTVTLEHVPDSRVNQVVEGFKATGATVVKTKDGKDKNGKDTWKVVATWS
jgi:hypothetical protein